MNVPKKDLLCEESHTGLEQYEDERMTELLFLGERSLFTLLVLGLMFSLWFLNIASPWSSENSRDLLSAQDSPLSAERHT